MGELISRLILEGERLLPERYRVRVVACTAFLGLCAWIYYSTHTYARGADVREDIVAAVQPLADQIKEDERTANRRYLEDLNSQILQTAGKCSEVKTQDSSKEFYQASLTSLLERYENTAGHPYPQAVTCN